MKWFELDESQFGKYAEITDTCSIDYWYEQDGLWPQSKFNACGSSLDFVCFFV